MKTTFLVLLSFILFFTKAAIAQFSGDWVYTTNGNAVTIVGYLGLGGALNVPSTINGLPVTRIGADVFHSFTGLTTITIPEGVVDIGNNAFAFCSSLTTVVLPESLTSIGHSSFYSCQRLASITIPINVTNIVEYGFSGCSGLTNITIWSSTLTMGMANFADCSSLISVFFMGNAPTITWDHTTFSGDDHATVYYIPGTTGWGATTFDGRPTQLWIPLPAITQQPLGVTTNRGATVTVTVSASSPFPISYQWTFNGTNISGATNSRFTITGITPERLGTYAVLLTNAYGAVTSSNAVLSLYAYTVNAHINGQGSVSVNPEQASYLDGTSVTVTAVPADGWAFVGWSGNLSGEINPATLLITGSNKSLTANFKPLWQFNATAGIGGTVSWTPQQINYLDGALITVTAVASNGFAFTGWSGVTNSPVNPLLLKLSGNAEVQAHFVAPARVDLSSLNQTYDGTARAVIATTTPPALALNLSYNGSSSPPTNAGIYTVIATVSDPVYRGSTTNTLVIGKATALVTLSGLSQSYDGTAKPVMVDTTPSNLWVSVIYDGSVRVPINAGNYTAVGTINNVNYQGSATNTLVIGKATALVTLSGLYQTYDGTAKPVTVNTTPSNVTVTVTYNGSVSIPINAGSYTVVGTVNNVNYQGSATNTLVIGKATALVALSGLSQMYDGTAKPVTVSTTPSGLTVSVTYDGSVSIPINAGSYTVAGTVNNANYQGSAINTLVIGKATALVALIGLSQMYDGTAKCVTFSTTPSNLLASLSYDWSSTCPSDVGVYIVIGTINDTNYLGSATNTLTIYAVAPVIVQHPHSQTVSLGSDVNFTVVATGAPLFFQWRKNGVDVSGATNSTFIITNVQFADAGAYKLVVSNSGGMATTEAVILTVVQPVSITGQPQSTNVNLGGTVSFTILAGGGDTLSYQWLRNATPIPGAISTSLTITNAQAADDADYSVLVSNIVTSASSTIAHLLVVIPPVITTQPLSRTNLAGTTASFSVTAAGTNPNYQWRKAGIDLMDATNSTLTLIGISEGSAGVYDAVVWNPAGWNVSTAATLTVLVPATIITSPTNESILLSNSLTFNVVAYGTGPLQYQWRKYWLPIQGATNNSYSIESVRTSDAGSYDVLVTNVVGRATSSNAMLIVLYPPSFLVQPSNSIVALDGTAAFSVVADGVPAPTYQWYLQGAPLPGCTNSGLYLTEVTATEAGTYHVVISNSCGYATSTAATLTVVLPALTLAEALDAPGFLWTTGGNSPWIPQTNVTSDGVDAAVSGTITNYQQSWVETVVNGPGQVTFMWKASSEFGFDLLTFVVNGVQQAQLSGETEWLQRTQSVSPGQHELRWVYSKDGSDSAGLDCGWLDQVKYVPEPGVAQPVYVLTSKVRQRDGLFQMDMLGEPGKTITVEASTNLSNWLPLVMITNWTGSSRFTDPDTAANPSRYYRLRTP